MKSTKKQKINKMIGIAIVLLLGIIMHHKVKAATQVVRLGIYLSEEYKKYRVTQGIYMSSREMLYNTLQKKYEATYPGNDMELHFAINTITNDATIENDLDITLTEDDWMIIIPEARYKNTVTKLAPQRVSSRFITSPYTNINMTNVNDYHIQTYDMAYIFGIIAAKYSKSGKVAYVGPVNDQVYKREANAFTLGARSVNSQVTVVGTWINGQGNKATSEGLVDLLTNHHQCDVIASSLLNADLPLILESKKIFHLLMNDFDFLGILHYNLLPISTNFNNMLVDMIMFDIAQDGYSNSPYHHIPIGSSLYLSLKNNNLEQADYDDAVTLQQGFSLGHNNLTFLNTDNTNPLKDKDGNIQILPSQSLTRDQVDAMDYFLDVVNVIGLYQEPLQTCGEGYSYTFAASSNTLTCTACEPGTYAPVALPNSCRQCPENMYSPESNMTFCFTCANGTFADPGSESCYSSVNVYIIIGVTAGAAAVFVCLIIIILLFVIHFSQYPRLRYAPSKGVCTFVSIDFEHQQLLEEEFEYELDNFFKKAYKKKRNKLLKKYRGYLFKETVESGQVYAFERTSFALNFVLELQKNLMFDFKYPAKLLCCNYCQTVYDENKAILWRGPRLRVGIHSGTPIFNYKRLQAKFSYRGQCVDVASHLRVAAAEGGRFLISNAAYQRIIDDRDAVEEKVSFEKRVLMRFSGATKAMRLFEVIPEHLSKRTFRPIPNTYGGVIVNEDGSEMVIQYVAPGTVAPQPALEGEAYDDLYDQQVSSESFDQENTPLKASRSVDDTLEDVDAQSIVLDEMDMKKAHHSEQVESKAITQGFGMFIRPSNDKADYLSHKSSCYIRSKITQNYLETANHLVQCAYPDGRARYSRMVLERIRHPLNAPIVNNDFIRIVSEDGQFLSIDEDGVALGSPEPTESCVWQIFKFEAPPIQISDGDIIFLRHVLSSTYLGVELSGRMTSQQADLMEGHLLVIDLKAPPSNK